MSPAATIYMLVDPRTREIRYVGKTEQPLRTRLSAHMRDTSKCHRTNWLKSLAAESLAPEIVPLEEVSGEWPWQESERYWIARLRSLGARLTNGTSGGDGVRDLAPEARERIRAAWVGRKHTPETLQKLRVARSRRATSDATRAKMSITQRGRRITWGSKIAQAVRKLSDDDMRAILSRLNSGETVTALAAAFSVHRTTISKVKAGTYAKAQGQLFEGAA